MVVHVSLDITEEQKSLLLKLTEEGETKFNDIFSVSDSNSQFQHNTFILLNLLVEACKSSEPKNVWNSNFLQNSQYNLEFACLDCINNKNCNRISKKIRNERKF